MNRLAQQIKDARLKAKMSEKDLAQKAGVTVSYLLQIESGKKVVNEATAQKILDVLGADMRFVTEEKTVEVVEKKVIVPSAKPIEPNAQWKDILSGVIKRYPVVEERSGKEVGGIEHVISSKKIDGIAYDKVFYIKLQSTDLTKMRMHSGDVLMCQALQSIENGSVYYVMHQQKKRVYLLRVDNGKRVSLMTHINDQEPVVVEMSDLNVIGKVMKVEFYLP